MKKPSRSLKARSARVARKPAAKPVTIHAAKTNLSKLIKRACAGEEVVIARGKTPVVKIVPVEAEQTKVRRKPGAWKGRFKVDDSFFEPLPEEELRRWEGYDD
jgi:prevent-host-death family protein